MSAIKAKLVELGAYVDEELPDYIMVMVANKKTRLQMTEDLNLFLGGNTDKFTAWLHSLITKLQSISSDSPPEGKEEEKTEKEKIERKKSTDKKKSSTSEVPDDKPKKKTEKSTVVSKDEIKPKPSKPKEPVVEKQPSPPSPVPEPEEPEFTVRADTDEFSEELKEIEKQAEAKKAEVATPKTHSPPHKPHSPPPKAPASAPAPKSSASTASASHPPEGTREKYVSRPSGSMGSRLGERRSVPRTETRLDGRCVVSSDKPSTRRTAVMKNSSISLKRKAPSSVVTPVANRVEEEEEEYDPHNPSVGNVASVVRVTARKSSIPRSLQANKTLLMKAMTDAEKSITTGAKRSITVTEGRHERGHQRSLYSDSLGRVTVDNSRLRYSPQQPGLTSRSKKEEIMRRMKYTIEVESPDDNTEETGSEEELVPDNRVVEVNPEEEEEEEASSPEVVVATASDSDVVEVVEEVEVEPEEGEAIPVILEEEEVVDEFRHVLAEEEEEQASIKHSKTPQQQQQQQEQQQQQLQEEAGIETENGSSRVVKENPKNTKFIVTLDGIDPDQYESMDVDMEEPEKPERVTEMLSHVTPPKIKSFSINLKDSDDEDDPAVTPLKRAKMTEKCRYWPACVNGNSCEYHHPTVPCKTFPSCKFGDKCLYIHPNCKYDARCTKTDCPFTHASKRKPVTVSPPQVIAIPQPKVIVAAQTIPPPPSRLRQVTCKYYPNCHNMMCLFKHPKPCRYGVGCAMKAACPFYHPALPTKDKLTWKSNKPGQSGTTSTDGIKAS